MGKVMSFEREELQLLRNRASVLAEKYPNASWARAHVALADAACRIDAMIARTEIVDSFTQAAPREGGFVGVESAGPPAETPDLRLRDRVWASIVNVVARRERASHDAVAAAVEEATANRPLLDWIRSGELKEFIAFVVSLLPLFL